MFKLTHQQASKVCNYRALIKALKGYDACTNLVNDYVSTSGVS